MSPHQMCTEEIQRELIQLESAGIRYCIVGGLASIAYGRPRLTLDADLVVALTTIHATKFADIILPEDFYTPPPEV